MDGRKTGHRWPLFQEKESNVSKNLVESPYRGGPVREEGLCVMLGWSHESRVFRLETWNGWKVASSPSREELLAYIKEMGFVLEKDYTKSK